MDKTTQSAASRSASAKKIAQPEGNGPVLGPDGEEASELARSAVKRTKEFQSDFGRLVSRNPVLASTTALGIGVIIGMVVGAAVARD